MVTGLRLAFWFVAIVASGWGPVRSEQFEQAVRDSSGVTWWLYGADETRTFARLEGDRPVPADYQSPLPGGYPVRLGKAHSGGVWCLWTHRESRRHALTEHHGEKHRLIGIYDGQLREPRLFADSQQNVWLLDRGPTIWRVDPDGKLDRLLTNDDDLQSGDGGDYTPYAIEDGRGHVWLWVSWQAAPVQRVQRPMIYRWDGKRLETPAALIRPNPLKISLL